MLKKYISIFLFIYLTIVIFFNQKYNFEIIETNSLSRNFLDSKILTLILLIVNFLLFFIFKKFGKIDTIILRIFFLSVIISYFVIFRYDNFFINLMLLNTIIEFILKNKN